MLEASRHIPDHLRMASMAVQAHRCQAVCTLFVIQRTI